jgi:hypothetical protein
MNISAYSLWGVPTTGFRVIALVPPAKAGNGRDIGSIFVILSSSNFNLKVYYQSN